MPKVRISGIGNFGLASDQPGWNLPPNGVNFGRNVRFNDRRMSNFPGYEVYTTAPIPVHGLFGFSSPDRKLLWLEAGLNKAYVYDGTTHYNITRESSPGVDEDYAMDELFGRWTGGISGTLGFLCNGHFDAPQQWDQVNLNTRLKDMIYDPQGTPGTDQTWKEQNRFAYAMRPYKNTILAMNLQQNSTTKPGTVQWCDFIEPNQTSLDWVARPTNRAGRLNLGDTAGNIIDGAPLRDDFIVYKEDSAWILSFVGGNEVFQPRRLPEYVRIINRNCIGVTNELQIVASNNDVMAFDGNNFRSILNDKMRRLYSTELFPARALLTYIAVSTQEKEAWICYPSQDEVGKVKYSDKAIVWNYQDDTLSDTDLPECRDMDEGVVVPEQQDAFDDPPDVPFDQWFGPFDEQSYQVTQGYLVGAHNTEVSRFGLSATANGVPKPCQGERHGLIITDTEHVLRVRRIRPYVRATAPIFFAIGSQMSPGDGIEWEPEQVFDPRTQNYLSVRSTGRFFSWRIRSLGDQQWDFTDLEMEYEEVRRR